MKLKSESEVAQVCPTLSDPMDCSLPGSSVHGMFQARVLEWGMKSPGDALPEGQGCPWEHKPSLGREQPRAEGLGGGVRG